MFEFIQNTKYLPRRQAGKIPNTKKGFTLIELLVVIAIISVLAGLLMANFVGVRQRGRDAQRKSELRQIQSALELYRSDNGGYPTTVDFPDCGQRLTDPDGTVTYMTEIPCDPLEESGYPYESDGFTYQIYACLENVNDADAEELEACSTNVSFTLNNP